jgi:outer membrane protein assembly factor BamB
VLEFFYRAAKDDAPAELVAGLMTESQFSDSVAGRFAADGTWRFGRVAIKNGADCKKLLVGFSSSDGECLVDQIQFRQIRYPSVNHLLYEPLHAIQPVVLDNPLFSAKYDPAGNLRDAAPNRVMIPTLPGPLNLVESAFMQNGRLNETSSHWYIQPYSRESGELLISLSLKEPRWVSTLALHFNQYQPENVTPHFDILAVDPETGRDKVMASIRHNGQVFRVVKFTPIKTTLVKLVLVNTIERLRTLSEIELYGPLSGREGEPGFIDTDGQNTYMGDFSRVDKRSKTLAADYLPPVVKRGGHDEESQWSAPLAQPLIADGFFYLARTFGRNSSHRLAEPAKDISWARAGGLGYTPFGALYGGLLLRCGNDGKLYCLNPDTGTELWSTSLGQRLFGCPVAIGEDVFVTSDQQKLYQLDLASGTIMKETALTGLVFGSLATDGKSLLFITDDGQLNAYDPVSFQPRWTLPVAPATDSTPAIDGGVIYLADQQGRAMAVDVATGKPRWTTELKDEFARCPVVGPTHVVFGCRGGTLVALNRADGKLLWSKDTKSRFEYEPLLVSVPGTPSASDQILFFRGGTAMLAKLSDGSETPWQITSATRGRSPIVAPPFTLPHDPVVPLSFYKGHLIFIDRPSETGHNTFQVNQPWHPVGGAYTVLAPVPAPN